MQTPPHIEGVSEIRVGILPVEGLANLFLYNIFTKEHYKLIENSVILEQISDQNVYPPLGNGENFLL
jgi:hypothetical protein